jgi:Ca2+-binding RTX toxin-like protein
MAIIDGTNGNDVLHGTIASDTINGMSGHDELFGHEGNDTLNGDLGDDLLFGDAGDDQLLGGNGNDRLNGGLGYDVLIGGTGIDTADYSNGDVNGINYTGARGGVTVTLGLVGAQNTGGADSDTLVSIENLTGTIFTDTLTGDSGNNVLDGGAGADTMNGGFGDDTYVVDQIEDVVIDPNVRWLSGGIDTVESSVNYTLGATIENLRLIDSANRGIGNALNNVLWTGYLNGVLDGGTGNDTLLGHIGDDTLIGGTGNDSLDGDDGNDRLDGGSGADFMRGGFGNDTFVVDDVGDVVRDGDQVPDSAPGGYDTVESSIAFSLGEGLDHLILTGVAAINGTGNELHNRLTGNSANNELTGLSGNDWLTGGDGHDLLDGGEGGDQLTGGTGDDQLNGSTGDDQLDGGDGHDLLIGGLGVDTMTGGEGNDRFDFNVVTESPGKGDRIIGFAGNDKLAGDQIDLTDIDAMARVVGNQTFTWIADAAFTAAGQLRYDTTHHRLQGNTDGNLTTTELSIELLDEVPLSALFVNPLSAGTDILL